MLAFLIENQKLGSVIPNLSRIMPHELDNSYQNTSLVCNFDNTVRRFTAEHICKSLGMDLVVARGKPCVFQGNIDEAKEERKCLQVVEAFQTAYVTSHT